MLVIWTSSYNVILTKNKEVADSFRSYFEVLLSFRSISDWINISISQISSYKE